MSQISTTLPEGVVLALDVGTARLGVARATTFARIASPLTFISNDDQVVDSIQKLIHDQSAVVLVIGLPRGLDGQSTQQTKDVRSFAQTLKAALDIPMFWQDEALTSKQAESELEAKGKPFKKGDIDALAACYILQDYLQTTEKMAI